MRIKIAGQIFRYPQICVCCMTPTSDTKEITHSETETMGTYQTTSTTKLQLPLCLLCQKHEKNSKMMLVICPLLVFILSIIAHRTIIPMRLRYSLFFGNFIFPIIALVIIGILTFILYKVYLRPPGKNEIRDMQIHCTISN
jgi:hypothetical protein